LFRSAAARGHRRGRDRERHGGRPAERRGAREVWHHSRLSGLHPEPHLQHIQVRPTSATGKEIAEGSRAGVQCGSAGRHDACVLTNHVWHRDFPADQIPPLSAISGATAPVEGQRSDMASYLNPWLARHAVLVCSTVKVRLGLYVHPRCLHGVILQILGSSGPAAQNLDAVSSGTCQLTGSCGRAGDERAAVRLGAEAVD